MSLTLVLVNREDMLRKILVPMLYLSRRGMVQCIRNYLSIQVRDAERRTMAVLTFKFHYFRCCLENWTECVVCIDLIALSLMVASRRDETILVHGNDRDRNIRFVFRGRSVVTRSKVTRSEVIIKHFRTLNLPVDWGIIDMRMGYLYEYHMGVQIPSREIRRALARLDSPTYVGLPSDLAVVVHVNCQEVRFTAREQSIEVHGWRVFGLQLDEQFVIRMTFKHIKSYIAASKFSQMVWLFKSCIVHIPDILVCPIIIEGMKEAIITYYFSPPIQY